MDLVDRERLDGSYSGAVAYLDRFIAAGNIPRLELKSSRPLNEAANSPISNPYYDRMNLMSHHPLFSSAFRNERPIYSLGDKAKEARNFIKAAAKYFEIQAVSVRSTGASSISQDQKRATAVAALVLQTQVGNRAVLPPDIFSDIFGIPDTAFERNFSRDNKRLWQILGDVSTSLSGKELSDLVVSTSFLDLSLTKNASPHEYSQALVIIEELFSDRRKCPDASAMLVISNLYLRNAKAQEEKTRVDDWEMYLSEKAGEGYVELVKRFQRETHGKWQSKWFDSRREHRQGITSGEQIV